MKVTGKRLLILGSTKPISEIVSKAKQMGVYTVVTDNRPLEKAPAKQIADKYFNIDFSDTETVVQLIREERIDGVLTGFTDSYMQFYLDICEAAGLPCYGNQRQIDIATDKAVFKQACLDAGVPVIPGTTAESLEQTEEACRQIGYPVMMKPIDNSGSRGVIKCENETELSEAYRYAMSFSSAGKIIIEKYMDCDNMAVSYFAADGDIRLSTTDDRWVYKSDDTGSSVSAYSEYPSVYTDRYIAEVNDLVIRMLKENGFRNGMVSLQAFVDDSSFYFCEMCFRPSGGRHYLLTYDQSGIDQLGLLIEFALTGNCSKDWEAEKETPYFREHYAMLRILGIPGRVIHRMEGFKELAENARILTTAAVLPLGARIGKAGTTAQVVGTVQYRFSETEDAVDVAKELLNCLTVQDEAGNSIIWISIEKRI